MKMNMSDFMIDADGIVVTAGAYQNAENKSDEDPTDRSPSSTVMKAGYRIQIEEVDDSKMRLSPCSLRGRGFVGADCYSVQSASHSNYSMQPMSFGEAYRATLRQVTAGGGEFEVDGGSSTENEGVTPSQSAVSAVSD